MALRHFLLQLKSYSSFGLHNVSNDALHFLAKKTCNKKENYLSNKSNSYEEEEVRNSAKNLQEAARNDKKLRKKEKGKC